MSAPIRVATPGRASAVTPVQWSRAFAYTPDVIPTRNNSQCLDQAVDDPESVEDDALPTQFRPRSVRDASHPGIDTVSREGLDAYYSIPDPASTVPAKRWRRSRCTGVSSCRRSPCEQAPIFSAVHREGTQSVSAMGANARNPCSSVSNSPSHPRSRRLMLDAVEIVSKRQSQLGRRETVRASSTESKSAFSHYPSPPASCTRKNTTVDDSTSLDVHPITECVSPNQLTTPLKVSKYFTSAFASLKRPRVDNVPVLTPPSSPISIIPACTGSSDSGYPPPTVLLDEPEEVASGPSPVSSWKNTSGLFGDLMVMLRRLKPLLIQESVKDDPWKVLIAVRLLNVTTGKAAIPVFCKIISRWPTPQDLAHASQDELVELLRPLGLYNKRAQWLKDVSQRVLQERQDSKSSSAPWGFLLSEVGTVPDAPHLRYPGVGLYALDSLRIFCARDKNAWMHVMPRDKELIRYLRWRWAAEKYRVWYPEGIGVIGDVDVSYLITLVDELAIHYDDAIGGEGYMYHFCNDLCDMLNNNTAE